MCGHCWVDLMLVRCQVLGSHYTWVEGGLIRSWLLPFFDEGLDSSVWFVQTELLPVWLWGLWGGGGEPDGERRQHPE